ncbi:MAG: phenylacetate-CoA oxygenase subunit PaaJ [Acidimicrobiales bacterium]|nr:phenylacetate-CoA oxygenase subunit PaaJ [Acidimicrobiales bacterium]
MGRSVPAARDPELAAVWAAVAAVTDPEVPVLTIEDLGVLRSVDRVDGRIVVTITPTYSGCPAMQYIADRVEDALSGTGSVGEVRTVLSPAWTTDWMSEEGRRKLTDYGIAAPVTVRTRIACPRCSSRRTRPISEFGSTACKALYRCEDCLEPFDYFKELL